MEPDFEVVDEKPKKRVTADEDDDEPRRKKKRYDDDDDDDDDDDRPRARKKRGTKTKRRTRYEDDGDDDWQPQARNGGPFAKGKTGALLLGISFWLNLGAYGLLALYALIFWVMVNGSSSSGPSSSSRGSSSGDGDGSFLDVMVILPGLLGLGAWIVGTVGSSIAIAGPQKARGMAITATVFAGLHLILTGVTFSNLQDGLGGFGRSLPGVGKIAWIVVASTLPALDTFLPMLFYQSKAINGDYIVALLAAICEAGRLIFMLLTLKALAAAARDYEAAGRAHMDVIVVALVLGGVALLTLFVAILLREGGFKSISTYANLAGATFFLMYLGYTFMMLLPALVALEIKDACARRS